MEISVGLPPGTVIRDRYEIVRELGRGERSFVYEARDRQRDRPVTIKLLAPTADHAHFVRERLEREARAVGELDHASIVRPLEVLEHGPWCLLITQHVRARDLETRVAGTDGLALSALAVIGTDVAEALSAAHRIGVIHRDVKPRNVLIDDDGRAHLTDFGCARVEDQALLAGAVHPVRTVGFLPPEVIAGHEADPRSDVYALGMTLYYALVGHVPRGPEPQLPPAPLAEGYHPALRRPDVPAWLDELIARATRAEPGERFTTTERLAEAFETRGAETPTVERADEHLLGICVLCRESGTLGRAVCPHCEDSERSQADTFVFLDPDDERRGASQRLASLAGMTNLAADDPALLRTAEGRRPLVQVSRAQAGRILLRLQSRGLAARTVGADVAWAETPREFLVAAGATLLLGFGLALFVKPLLLLSGILVAPLWLALGASAVAERTLIPERTGLPPAGALVGKVSEVMPALELREARKLLVEILRLGHGIEGRLCCDPDAAEPACTRLLAVRLAASEAARELASLDSILDALRLHGEHKNQPPPGMLQSRGLYASARTRLVQGLLETTAAFSRLLAEELLHPEDAAASLERMECELLEELDTGIQLAKEAAAVFPGMRPR